MAQIKKGQDSQRQQDLKQLNSALDAFYNDKNCYPQSIPQSGTTWANGQTVYMQKVSSDPTAINGGQNYAYVTDGSTCPQWNVLFAKVNSTPNVTTACPLNQMSNCFPTNNTKGYNYCVISGNVACPTLLGIGDIAGYSILSPSGGGGGGTPPPTPTNTPIPTPSGPTPTPCLCGSVAASWDQDGALCDSVPQGSGLYCDHIGDQCINRCQ